MKILVKIPSRERPKELLTALSKAYTLSSRSKDITYLVTLDNNDHSTNNEVFESVLRKIPANIIIDRGVSSGKIHACNRGINTFKEDWDILLLLSDDMICQTQDWDQILINEMKQHFPDTDGVLFHNDGYCEQRLNTLCILGKKYFDRFGYIYNPNYISLWSDNEFMEVAKRLKKQVYFPQVLFKHIHPANTGKKDIFDTLYDRNNKYYQLDQKTYERRKSIDFGL